MANRAFLLLNESASPGFPDRDDAATPTLAAASYIVPALWLSVFEIDDLQEVDVSDDPAEPYVISCPVRAVTRARPLLRSRSDRLRKTFASHIDVLQAWTTLIEDAADGYLTMELTEIAALCGNDALKEDLAAALRWFETGSQDDFQGLQRLACFGYDGINGRVYDERVITEEPPKRRWFWPFGRTQPILPPRRREPIWPATFLVGYEWEREVPWTTLET